MSKRGHNITFNVQTVVKPARTQLTALVAFPLLDLERQVEGADGEVDCLGVHSSHLADNRHGQGGEGSHLDYLSKKNHPSGLTVEHR